MSPSHSKSHGIGANVRRLRFRAGLYQKQLADRIGVSQARISQIESGRDTRKMTPRMIFDLADALGVDVETLVGNDPAVDLSAIVLDDFAGQMPIESARPISELIGRDADLDYLRKLIVSEKERLISLVGPGGVGKTQLALHLEKAVAANFPSQPVFAALATASDSALALAAIARQLGLRERDALPLRQRIISSLDDRQSMLILDSTEHVSGTIAALTVDLLHRCPELIVLTTGRRALGIADEFIYDVLPLPVPEPSQSGRVEFVSASPAVQLFVRQAQNIVPWFAVDDGNAEDVAAICRRVGGLPLALELAAPQLRIHSPRQLRHGLERQLDVLAGGKLDRPTRHQSLRACIDWSYSLLPPGQQTILQYLSVFENGFTLESANCVLGQMEPFEKCLVLSRSDGSGDQFFRESILALAEQFMITCADWGAAHLRFKLPDSIREFARAKLEASCRSSALRDAHLAWCLSIAEESVSKIYTAEEYEWIDHLSREEANLESALRWSLAQENGMQRERGLLLAAALTDFWYVTGRYATGRRWLNCGITLARGGEPSIGAARCYVGACQIEQTQALVKPAAEHCEAGLKMATMVDDPLALGRGLLFSGNLALARDQVGEARRLHEAALGVFTGQQWPAWRSLALLNLGIDAIRDGRPGQAGPLVSEALEIACSIGDRWEMMNATFVLGDIALAEGDLVTAETLFVDYATIARHLDSGRDLADALAGLAEVFLAMRVPRRAARVAAAAEALFQRHGIHMPPPLRPNWISITSETRAQLAAANPPMSWPTVDLAEFIENLLGNRRDWQRSFRRQHRPKVVVRKSLRSSDQVHESRESIRARHTSSKAHRPVGDRLKRQAQFVSLDFAGAGTRPDLMLAPNIGSNGA